MDKQIQPLYTHEQMTAWIRGLLTIAWIDGRFSNEEQELIKDWMQEELIQVNETIETITPAELAVVLGKDKSIAENFLRTAVMVALADGVYSSVEDDLLHEFAMALGQKIEAFDALRMTLVDEAVMLPSTKPKKEIVSAAVDTVEHPHLDPLKPVRVWLDQLEIHDPKLARYLCRMIPSQCPFERDVVLFGHKVLHIPPMCKLNPLYEQLVGLRFRAMCYLADTCGEDVSPYC
ncbi:MAG: Mo-dependent nitrogenase C-terminal domain-containing protein [Gloeobacterales cyanobacterium]